MNGCRIFPTHVFLIPEQSRMAYRFSRQGQYLEESTVKGQQVFVDETVPGKDIFIDANGKQGTDLVVGIKRQSLPVSHHGQEKIEQQFVVRETAPETVAEKAMLDESKTAADCSDALGKKWISHDRPPFLTTVSYLLTENYRVLLCKIFYGIVIGMIFTANASIFARFP